LLHALTELLEQIDSLEGIEYTRDTEQYKAEACWEYALAKARVAVRLERTRQMEERQAIGVAV